MMAMPDNFRYRGVYLKGKPERDIFDSFRIKHPSMSAGRRAKIFAPFDALRGFGDGIASKKVQYEFRRELNCEEREELNRRLVLLRQLTYNGREARRNAVRVTIEYYMPCDDVNSESYGIRGHYLTAEGICLEVDPYVSCAIKIDDLRIPLKDIYSIESPDEVFRADPMIIMRRWETPWF